MRSVATTGISEIQNVDSDSVNLGSNPSPPATQILREFGFSAFGQVGPFGLSERFGRTKPGTFHSSVYFITDGDLTKIGWSEEPKARIKGIRSPSGAPLRLIGTVPAGTSDERAIHQRFKHLRVHGEWFQPDDELRRFIEFCSAYRVVDIARGQREYRTPDALTMLAARVSRAARMSDRPALRRLATQLGVELAAYGQTELAALRDVVQITLNRIEQELTAVNDR